MRSPRLLAVSAAAWLFFGPAAGVWAAGTSCGGDRALYERRALAFFESLRDSPSPGKLRAAAEVAAWTGDEAVRVEAARCVPSLVKAGADPEEAVALLGDLYGWSRSSCGKRAVIVALSSIRFLASFDFLLEAAESERDPALRKKVFWALRRLTGMSYPGDAAFWRRWRSTLGDLLDRISADIGSGDRRRVLGALAAVAALPLPSRDVLETAEAFLRDPDPAIREAACGALAPHEDFLPRVRPELEALSSGDADAGVRKAAGTLLRRLGGPRTVAGRPRRVERDGRDALGAGREN